MSGEEATTLHLRRARDGDHASLAWLIERFTPALLAQARFRLKRHLQTLYDPADLVQDVWLATLPRLSGLEPREGRLTPVLLRFLSRTMLNRYGTLIQKHMAGKPLRISLELQLDGERDSAERRPDFTADESGIVTQIIRRESVTRVLEAIDELSEADREILVLRSIEQVSLATAAKLLGATENALSVRHHRALQHLRERLPESIFADLPEQ